MAVEGSLRRFLFIDLKTLRRYANTKGFSIHAASKEEYLEMLLNNLNSYDELDTILRTIHEESLEIIDYVSLVPITVKRDELVSKVNENLFDYDERIKRVVKDGFQLSSDDTEGERLQLLYWYNTTKEKLTPTFEVEEIPGQEGVEIEFNFGDRLVFFQRSNINKAKRGKSALQKAYENSIAPMPFHSWNINEAVDKFDSFVNKLKELATSSNGHKMEGIEDLEISVIKFFRASIDIKDSKSGVRYVLLQGYRDIFENPESQEQIKRGGRPIYVAGKFRYKEHFFSFRAGHTMGKSAGDFAIVSLQEMGEKLVNTELRDEARNRLMDLYLEVFFGINR